MDFYKKQYELFIDSSLLLGVQLEAWRNFLNLPNLQLGEYFRNSLRFDRDAGCRLDDVDGIIHIMDFASEWNRHTIFSAVMKYHNIGFQEACQFIYYRLLDKNHRSNLGSQVFESIGKQSQFKFFLEFKGKQWDKNTFKDLNYGNITVDQLIQEDYFPVEQIWCNSKRNPEDIKSFKVTDRAFGYVIDNYKKIKFPDKPKHQKWLSSIPAGTIGGNKEIKDKDLIVVTKSMNDYLIISNCDVNCRFIKDENDLFQLDFITYLNTFDKVVGIMDNDKTGKQHCLRLQNQWDHVIGNSKAKFTHLPEHDTITDPFDYVREESLDKFKFQLDKLVA